MKKGKHSFPRLLKATRRFVGLNSCSKEHEWLLENTFAS